MSKSSDKGRFKHQLKSHYREKQLTADQICSLQSLGAPSQKFKVVRSVAIASSIVALILFFFDNQSHDFGEISKQIAYNHNIKLQMEVVSHDFDEVKSHLNRLGFTLASSSKVSKDEWKIIGGRYCNIGGKVAAQMEIVHTDSETKFTFYQAKVSDEFIDELKESEFAIDGVKVKLWREKGLLMGLAF